MRTHFQRFSNTSSAPEAGSQMICHCFAANELRAAATAIFTAAEDDRHDLNDPARRRYLKEAHRRAVVAIALLDQMG